VNSSTRGARSRAELLRASVCPLGFGRPPTAAREQRRTECDVELDLALGALVRVRQLREQLDRPPVVATPSRGALRRLALSPAAWVIQHGARNVAAAVEMHRELRGPRTCAFAECRFEPVADSRVPGRAGRSRQAFVERGAIQGVAKSVPAGERAVGPHLGTGRIEELAALRKLCAVAARVDEIRIARRGCGKRVDQRGLADPCFADEEHDLPLARACPLETALELGKLGLARDDPGLHGRSGPSRMQQRHEQPVAAPVKRFDVTRAPRIVLKGRADFLYARRERGVADYPAGPHLREQLLLTDELAGPLAEQLEHRRGFRGQLDRDLATRELARVGIEPIGTERELMRARHALLPREIPRFS
jgi:hypothetical protein